MLESAMSTYTADEVAVHNTGADCWVIVHGAVIDVTAFLNLHPGGFHAICKDGRAGLDVTSHFERIGHSQKARDILKSYQIGVLDEDYEINPTGDETVSLLSRVRQAVKGESDTQIEREHAIRWHSTRRRAILKDHPEVAELMGSNSWTCVIGLFTVWVHSYVCIWVQTDDCPWYLSIFLAYTIGAVCKMYQFSINHDICHGTAGAWLEKCSTLKHLAMQVMTLPTMGGAMHTYYEFQHIGHHASLGVHAIADALGVGKHEDRLHDPSVEKPKFKFDAAALSTILFFPDSDGDLFAIGNLSFGRILERWKVVGNDPHEEAGGGTERNERMYVTLDMGMMQRFHNWTWQKCILIQGFHIGHQATMATMLYVQGLLLPPILSIPLFLFPNIATQLLMVWTRKLNNGKSLLEELSDEQERFLMYTMIRIVSSVALHAWISLVVTWWLLFGHLHGNWTIGSVLTGFFYLYLSELFLYGFAMHPFMGYFLGVHRSGGTGFDSVANSSLGGGDANLQGCQPTMSTYSFFASLASLNLTYHVEHHDFPGVPWNRLPDISRLAPEYYENLEQSPGFCATIYRWIYNSGSWSYACQ